MKHIILAIGLFMMLASSYGQSRKVLLVGIDGCRQDALQAANTPNIDALIANATYSFDALTHFPTYSGPGWSSMLTGTWWNKHGVTDNGFNGSNFEEYPHFFNHIKAFDPNMYVASVAQWGQINGFIVDQADVISNENSEAAVTEEAVSLLAVNELDVLFLHYDNVDITGHAFGYGVDSPLYINAIESVDTEIGELMEALQQRPGYADEEWLIALSTDHGAVGFGHGGSSYEERNIFVVWSGDNFPNEQIVASYESWNSDVSSVLEMTVTNAHGWIDHPVYSFDANQDFTIECRVKTNDWEGDPAILSDKDWSDGYNPGFVLSCDLDGESWKFNLGDGDDRIDLDGGVINDGQWHHIAVSVDRDGLVYLWQDGAVISATFDSPLGSIISGLSIGVGQDGTLDYPFDFEGWIDELRIWNVALGPDILQEWACENVSTDHQNFADLIGHWKMEEVADLVIDGTDPNNQVDLSLGIGAWVNTQASLTCTALETPVPHIVDMVPTILTHLCIPVDSAWGLDGVVWGIDGSDCGLAVEERGFINLGVYPNPTARGEVEVNWHYEPAQAFLYDVHGALVLQTSLQEGRNTIRLAIAPGVFTLIARGSDHTATQRLVVLEQQ